jgi:hypothetical protein
MDENDAGLSRNEGTMTPERESRPFTYPPAEGETSMNPLSPRFARAFHTVPIAFDIDLGTGTLFQVHVDLTRPLRVLALGSKEETCPELSPEQEMTALRLAVQAAEAWFGWTPSMEGHLGSAPNPELGPAAGPESTPGAGSSEALPSSP